MNFEHTELGYLLNLENKKSKKQVKNVYNYEEVLANAVNQESEQEGA